MSDYFTHGRVFCRHTDKESLSLAIQKKNVVYPGGELNTSVLVKVIVAPVFTAAAGDRPDVRNVTVLITDGAPFINPEDAAAASTILQHNGIEVFVVCITTGCSEDFAKSLASPKKGELHSVNITFPLGPH